ncbi:centrosomal protein of 97 kDa [Orussus abietinus]|uniref:centrosomal protein of 97 kDa n=1 Tax=Orussus abietinus TaxID=222816 RepID=UPI000C7161EE|nr:centrosomal protein of 97 kDa [Orussus abietinus]
MSSELLQTLIIIGQNDITSLENISELRHLQELWVVECRVKDISQLNKCSKLEKVYLYSNEIDYIPCLSKCQRLKLLSLSGNNILECENLKFLKNLQYLYIARNGLKRFDELLSEDLQLRSVNFAGNPLTQIRKSINSFLKMLRAKYKDYLKKISKLRENLFVANIKYLHGKDIQAGQKFKLSEIYEERKQFITKIIGTRVHRITEVANKQIDTIRFSDEFSNLENVTLRILKSHPGVVELRQWPFHVLEHEFQDSKEVTLTDCLASADADFLIKIEKQRDDKLHSLMENNRRVCVLVKSPVEELNVK